MLKQRIFIFSLEEAYRHAEEVDRCGRTVLITCELAQAEFARDQIHTYGPDWRLQRSNGSLVAAFGDSRIALDDSSALAPFVGKRVILGVRPEHIEDAAIASDAPQDRRLAAVVDIREDLGSDVYVHFGVGGPPVLGEDVRAAVGSDAVETTAAQARRKGNLWIARVGHMSRAREGEPIELALDTARLQFFDPETGDRIDAEPGDRPA